MLVFWGLQPFWEYWKGESRRRGVGYIMRISPKITPTTNENYKSLLHTILDILCLSREVMRAMQAEFWHTIWFVRILSRNCLESHRIIENIILTQKSWNLTRKKNSSTLLYEMFPLCIMSNTKAESSPPPFLLN